MADGFFQSLGISTQLITAGALGGMVKAGIAKEGIVEALTSVTVGAATANYLGEPVTRLLSAVEIFGGRLELKVEFGAFFTGLFAYIIVEQIALRLRARLASAPSEGNPK